MVKGEGTVAEVLAGEARFAVVCGDAVDVLRELPPNSINATVTDPPYCSGGFTETARRKARGQGLRSETIRDEGWFEGDNMGTAGLVFLLRSVAWSAMRATREGGSFLCFCDHRQIASLSPGIESSGLRYTNLIVWDKLNAGLGSGFRAQHECVLHFTRGSLDASACDLGNVLRHARVHHSEREHQTEKPVALMRDLVRVVAPVGGLIVDPFAGSGPTLEAALREGIRAIGIERDPARCEKIRRRCAAAERDADWRAPAEQMDLFGDGAR